MRLQGHPNVNTLLLSRVVFRIGHRAFPVHDAAFGVRDDEELLRTLVRAGSVPVQYVRWALHHIAFADGLDRSTIQLVVAHAIGDDQDLAARVRMPVAAGAGAKYTLPSTVL